LAGLRLSKVLPDFAGTHLPLIKSFFGLLLRNSKVPGLLAPRAAISNRGAAAMMNLRCFGLDVTSQPSQIRHAMEVGKPRN
jgi:hypothetical protein